MSKALNVLKEIMFPVRKVDAGKYFKTNTQFNPGISHLIVADTPEGEVVVNTCSKNYGLVSNLELFGPLVESLDKESKLGITVKHYDYSKFYIDISIMDRSLHLMKKDDIIFPKIRINNSYDGSVKYSMQFGFYRVVCENGLTLPVKGKQSNLIKFRHTLLNARDGLQSSMDVIHSFIEEAPSLIKGYDDMLLKKIDKNEVMDRILHIQKIVPTYPKKKEEEIMARIQTEIAMGFPLNEFVLYNAMNHVLYHSESQMKEHKRDKIDSQIIHYLNK